MEKKAVTVRIRKLLVNTIKNYAEEEKTTFQDMVNELLELGLMKKTEKQWFENEEFWMRFAPVMFDGSRWDWVSAKS